MKKFFILCTILFSLCTNQAFAASDWADLYQKAQVADFELVHNLDPYQNEDYQKYAYAPYPLFRLSSDLYFKNQTIQGGYYILTPRTLNEKTYIFFKEGPKVKYIIPVVKQELVPVDFYHTNLPTPKYTKWQSFCNNTREGFYTVFRNSSKKAPPPKSYIVSEPVDGNYYLIMMYYGENKYYVVLKSSKY